MIIVLETYTNLCLCFLKRVCVCMWKTDRDCVRLANILALCCSGAKTSPSSSPDSISAWNILRHMNQAGFSFSWHVCLSSSKNQYYRSDNVVSEKSQYHNVKRVIGKKKKKYCHQKALVVSKVQLLITHNVPIQKVTFSIHNSHIHNHHYICINL